MESELNKQAFLSAKTLEELNKFMTDCRQCPLAATRKNIVFGSGNPNADVMVIGEAPGADEDEQGFPFV
ncbi:MAG: uracil-DNA glycosylase family protein, partial [Ignavibacteria bacterium]